jgi:DNA-binding NarL/FixJ family response regulator
MKTRIMLVDDHCMFREGIASLIDRRSDMECVAGAGNGRDALERAKENRPDLVIVDVSMPEMNGIETARRLPDACPGVKILALSGHAEHRVIVDMLRSGATGYVLKESPFSELVEAIHATERGRSFISPAAAGALVMDLVKSDARNGSAFTLLTDREIEILQAIAEGGTTKEIASRLSISVKTVETHRQQLMEKLDMHSVAELTKYAIREDITTA